LRESVARLVVRRHWMMMRWREGRNSGGGCHTGGAVVRDRPARLRAVRPHHFFSSLARGYTFPLSMIKNQASNFTHHRVRWLQNDPAAVRVWPSTGELWDELQLIGFLLFWPIRSYGYYAWRPYNIRKHDDPDDDDDDDPNHDGKNTSMMIQYEPLDAIIDAQDMVDRLDLTTQPPRLRNEQDLARIRLPYFFRTKKHSLTGAAGLWYENNQFPYGQLAAVGIHAATQRGVDWHQTDFCFSGSSVFAMLADRGVVTKTTSKDRRGNPRTTTSIDNDRSFYCCQIPGVNTILVADARNMKVHWNDAYHQFTRLVTTGLASALAEHDDPQEIVMYHHLHQLQVGEVYNVLCMSEVEAVTATEHNTDHLRPVAMTTTHPFRWEMLALNMIGSGCAMLCEGRQRPGCLTNITMHSLSKVAKDTIHDRAHIERIETNILRGLHDIREQLLSVQDDDWPQQTYQIVFVGSKLQLVPIQQANVLLPNDAVMEALLATTTKNHKNNSNDDHNMGAVLGKKEKSTD
jgi:hypothetical protein